MVPSEGDIVHNRRTLLISLIAGFAGLFSGRRTSAQQGSSLNSAEFRTGRNVVPLEDQLKNGLRVTTPGQQQYIRTVVAYVDHGQLPRAMVNLIYEWALKRNPDVPFPYFQYALRVLARKRGIHIP